MLTLINLKTSMLYFPQSLLWKSCLNVGCCACQTFSYQLLFSRAIQYQSWMCCCLLRLCQHRSLLVHCGGPSGPTATSPHALYLAHRLEVSQIWTRFHVTKTIPALWAFLKPAFLSAWPGIVGPVKALWIVSNLIVLILLPVRSRRKVPTVWVFLLWWSALVFLGTQHIPVTIVLFVKLGIVAESVMLITLLAFSVMHASIIEV